MVREGAIRRRTMAKKDKGISRFEDRLIPFIKKNKLIPVAVNTNLPEWPWNGNENDN
jgi:hypothetical protein